ncbi:MAG: Fic family protein [Desulfobacterales bacterium]|jgi:Fic family protein|nr:Fic family protein [Desulfobacterales bacterium]
MYDNVFHMTPYLPSTHSDLQDSAVEIIEKSAALAGKLHPITLQGLIDFLRITNTYYSNLIEDHNTHPVEIERAMAQAYDRDPVKRDLQVEARAHVWLERDLDHEIHSGTVRPTAPDFIRSIHRRFYEKLPDRFKRIDSVDGKTSVAVIPGAFRDHSVKVAGLVPVAPLAIESFMSEFDRQYDLSRFSRIEKLSAIAAAHHRLMWIHPFSDGNGRVARLFTGVCLKTSGIAGYDLWSINRGFARFKPDYMAALADADRPRQGDLDGRGNLSQKGLDRFCEFFFSICLDQIAFMQKVLSLEGLLKRIEQYIRLRANLLLPGLKPIKPEAFHLIKEAFLMGAFGRGEASQLTGLGERTARTLLSELIDEGLLVSDTPKGPVRLHFSAHLLPVWFPDLGPE